MCSDEHAGGNGHAWRSEGRDMRRSGYADAGGLDGIPSLQWECDVGDIHYQPTSAGGLVYAGSFGGTVYAVDCDTGQVAWEYPVADYIQMAPTVADGRVFVGGGDSRLHALDTDGDAVWTTDLDGVSGTPAVSGDTVVVPASGYNVHAIDTATGDHRWTATSPGDSAHSVSIASDTSYVGTDTDVNALDVQTGDLDWHTDVGAVLFTSVCDESVFAATRKGHIHALDRDGGSTKWETSVRTESIHGVSFDDETVFVATNWHLTALDRRTGEIEWQFESPDRESLSRPTIVEREVYVSSKEAGLLSLDLGSGDVNWQIDLPRSAYGSPIVVDGCVYVRCGSTVCCLS